MKNRVKFLDVVAFSTDHPERGLFRGQVGTVVEDLREGVFEVEFADQNGVAYAFAALPATELIVLRYEPMRATG